MELFRRKLITMVLAFGLISGAAIGAFLYYLLPQFYPGWYFGIVFFFLLVETLLINYVTNASSTASSKKMVNVYMLAKVIKMLAGLAFVAVYALVVKENIKSFVLVFILFYALYLAVETYLFSRIEKHIKGRNQL